MKGPFDTIAVTVIDGVGCGEADDCEKTYPEDRGANSLVHASIVQPIDAPALQSMGLERIPGLAEMRTKHTTPWKDIRGAFGAMESTFAGKGSPEGHQALMGWEVKEPYLYFDKDGFPAALIVAIERELTQLLHRPVEVIRYPGTDDVSGTVFINDPRIGEVHLKSGVMVRRAHHDIPPLKLPVYASSDSVIQIAIHQEVLPQKVIETIGRTVREKVCNALGFRVGRVIMRPFIGKPGEFERVSADRRDYASDPDGPTVIDHLTNAGVPVFGIGKAADMLNRRGFPDWSIEKGGDDMERMEILREWMCRKDTPLLNPPPKGEVLPHLRQGYGGQARGEGKLIFANLNATDELYGHRRKPKEYVEHINMIDRTIGTIMRTMNDRTLLIITSDHGNDPTHTTRMDGSGKPHTNHTRERVPLLCFSPRITQPIILGIRESYADIAATIAKNFGIELCHGERSRTMGNGKSFLEEITT
ncbi:phosphopentomutase [Candidatus Peregrinibacteria bacterium]|nr:phosphopentomutase [Candidatus Peregrinibacteria bacterium]